MIANKPAISKRMRLKSVKQGEGLAVQKQYVKSFVVGWKPVAG